MGHITYINYPEVYNPLTCQMSCEMCRKLLEHPIRDFYFICGSPVLPRNFRMRVTARDEVASDSEDSGPDDDLSSVTVQGGTTDPLQ